MKLSAIQPYFVFTRSQRSGLLILFALIVFLQLLYFYADFSTFEKPSAQEHQWLALQHQIDSAKHEKASQKPAIYPFNPNFITDFKGYRLGMSVAEIDRLHEFRKKNTYVNTAAEFQAVTKVSDSLLAEISPYFKFPDWVNQKKPGRQYEPFAKKSKKISIADINTATAGDLIAVYGIGAALSERIIKQRDLLGGFVDVEQVGDVWGLSPEVVANVRERFSVLSAPVVRKIKINDASVKELQSFPYFRYPVAKNIVTYRSMNGNITGAADLLKINGFPVGRAEIIALYLEF